MSRQPKKGLDYFPHDVDLSTDEKIQVLQADHGLIGFAIYIKLIERIYRQGYYINFSDRKVKIFALNNNINIGKCFEILETCLNENLFNKDIYEKYKILTSVGIQERYFTATNRRNDVEVDKKILLIKISKNMKIINVDINGQNIDINRDNVNINDENVDINTTKKRKEKKSKVKKSKEYTSKVFEAVDYFFTFLDASEKERFLQYRENYLKVSDKLFRIDKYKIDDIKKAIKFAKEDDFWSSNFESFAKLRQKNKSGTKYIDVFLLKSSLKDKNNNTTNNSNQNNNKGGVDKFGLPIGNWSYFECDIYNAKTIEEIEHVEKQVIAEFGKDDELIQLAEERKKEIKNKDKDIGYDMQDEI